MFEEFIQLFDDPRITATAIAIGSIFFAFVIEVVVINALRVLASRTTTSLDDLIVDALQRPLFFSVIFIGVSWAGRALDIDGTARFVLNGVLYTLAVLLWTTASLKIGTAVLRSASRNARPNAVLQLRTVPMFDILLKVFVIIFAAYGVLVSWDINVGAWIASAGVLGVAIGFAAKDSLANLFAGIFIIADAPYKIGDYIRLSDSGMCGTVTDIGMRSTRLITRDDIEINVPNSLIGNDKVINETAGPYRKARVAAKVSVAYGSDVDAVFTVLRAVTQDLEGVAESPEPIVLFNEFGGSGLEFSVLVWIKEPRLRENVISELNTRIYKGLAEADIEIPYSKHDVFIKQFPGVELPPKVRAALPTKTPPARPVATREP